MPPTTLLTAGEVMDRSASLMNDTAKTVYTYVTQLPYLNIALDDLQMEFELNNVPVTNKETSPGITINVGVNRITSTVDTTVGIPHYADNLIEIQGLYERLAGSTDPFIQMTRKEFSPHALDGIPSNSLIYWNWQEQIIFFNTLGALTIREVKIDYIKALFIAVTDQSTQLNVINAKNFLAFRTAALCSEFIGANKERADALNSAAQNAMDQALGISTKGRQVIFTRRRPFRANYRARGTW